MSLAIVPRVLVIFTVNGYCYYNFVILNIKKYL